MNIRKVADKAIEEVMTEDKFTTLAEHDRVYHPGGYKQGDDCMVRERLEQGDSTEEALKLAVELEESQKTARAIEKNEINRAFRENIGIIANEKARAKYGSDIAVSDQDKNGDVMVVISAFPVTPDSAVTKEMVKKVAEGEGKFDAAEKAMVQSARENSVHHEQYLRQLRGLGYRLKDFQIKTLKGNNVKNGGKKLFIAKLHSDKRIGELSKGARESFGKVAAPEKPMTETDKSLALKRYGYKIDNGQVKHRAGREDETPAEAYLRRVGLGDTVAKTNAEIKERRAAEKKSKEEERKNFLDELGLMGDDFWKNL